MPAILSFFFTHVYEHLYEHTLSMAHACRNLMTFGSWFFPSSMWVLGLNSGHQAGLQAEPSLAFVTSEDTAPVQTLYHRGAGVQ